MSISSYMVLETAVDHILSLLGKERVPIHQDVRSEINFLYKEEDDRITAVDIRSKVPVAMLHLMAENLLKHPRQANEFIFITPYKPTRKDVAKFKESFRDVADTVQWLTLDEYAKKLGLKGSFELESPALLEQLKAAKISTDLFAPQEVAESKEKPTRAESVNRLMDSITKGETEIPREYLHLNRKFPVAVLRELKASNKSPEEFFRIGEPSRDAVIVISDIQNFSKIVRAAYSEDLNEAMFTYYRRAQELIFHHGGILDKFIGDSVLAVFNYPLGTAKSYLRAVKFAADLIVSGQQIMSSLQYNIDEKIETGTRVGIAAGEIWTLNIGVDEIDITFVGDKINLAARLESNCAVDGILMSNIMQRKIAEIDSELFNLMGAEKTILKRKDVKGQDTDIITWQVPPARVAALAGEPQDG